jgi:esterase
MLVAGAEASPVRGSNLQIRPSFVPRATRRERRRLVCVSGLDGAVRDWSRVSATLARHDDVVVIELTLHAPRDAARRSNPLQIALDALGRVLADEPQPTVLLGHSMGALVSMLLAANEPDSVCGLVLTAPFLPFARGRRSTLQAMADYARHRALFLADARGRQHKRRGMRRVDRRTQAAALRALAGYGARPAVFHAAADRVHCPVLLVHGGTDHYVPPEFALAAAVRHPVWQLCVVPAAGHFPHRDDPTGWLASVEPWLLRI